MSSTPSVQLSVEEKFGSTPFEIRSKIKILLESQSKLKKFVLGNFYQMNDDMRKSMIELQNQMNLKTNTMFKTLDGKMDSALAALAEKMDSSHTTLDNKLSQSWQANRDEMRNGLAGLQAHCDMVPSLDDGLIKNRLSVGNLQQETKNLTNSIDEMRSRMLDKKI